MNKRQAKRYAKNLAAGLLQDGVEMGRVSYDFPDDSDDLLRAEEACLELVERLFEQGGRMDFLPSEPEEESDG